MMGKGKKEKLEKQVQLRGLHAIVEKIATHALVQEEKIANYALVREKKAPQMK